MKWTVYYLAHALMNVVALFLFRDHLTVNAGSIAPIVVMSIMILQATLTFNENTGLGSTAHSESDRLSSDEKNLLVKNLKTVFLITIPFAIPFIFFLPLFAKLLSILLYFIAYIIAGVRFKIMYGKDISDRLSSEREELIEQRKKEENGEI